MSAVEPRGSRLTVRDLVWIGCSWLLGCWSMFAVLNLPTKVDQTAGIVVGMAVVVMLSYLLAKAVAERELGDHPDEVGDA